MAKEVITVTKEDALPAFLAGYQGPATNTMMDSDDCIVPRIKLLQAISPELKSFNDAKEGVYWHSILNQSLGSELRFVTVLARKSYVLFAPRGDERVILARAPDARNWDRPNQSFEVKIKGFSKPVVYETRGNVAESGLSEFGSSMPGDPQSPPAATLVYEYLVYLPDHPDCSPALISLSRSGIKRGKDLNSKIQLRSTTVPQYAQIYKAVVTNETSAEGGYNGWSFKSDGVTDESTFNRVVALAKIYEATNFRASDADMTDDMAGSAVNTPF
jgi:hypothetical protein